MAKKKTSQIAYTPLSNVNPIPEIQIKSIPPYNDRGIKYQGYSKKNVGNGEYSLYPQIPRIQRAQISGAAGTNATGTRLDLGKKFYASSFHIDCSSTNSGVSVVIGDGSSAQPRMVFTLTAGVQHFNIDCYDSPREFSNDVLDVTLSGGMGGASDFLDILMIGWAE